MRTQIGHRCADRMDSSSGIRHHQGMNENRRRLANYVRARRIELGWRQAREFAEATELTPQTISAVETGRPVRADTLSIIDTKLRWTPGSAENILAGGEPESTEQPIPGTPAGDKRSRELMRRRAEMIAARDQLDAWIAELDGEVEASNARRTV